MDKLEAEAQLFAHYLIGRRANPQVIRLYRSTANDKLDADDQKLLDYMKAHSWSISFIDAGLVFHKPASRARRRLYLMLAILEANTEYSDLFLAKNRGPLYLFVIAATGVRAVARIVLGLALVKIIRP